MKTELPHKAKSEVVVADSDPKAPQDDEVILYVRYTTFLTWFMGISALTIAWVFCYCGSYFAVMRGKYLAGLVIFAGALVLFAVGVDYLFTRYILFYRDRIVKVWHFLGRRTIPYERAKLDVNWPWGQYVLWIPVGKPFRVYETDAGNKVRLIQVPIFYCFLCVSPEIREKVEAIIRYLVGVEDKSKLYGESRIFVKSNLPKDILGQDQDQGKTYNSWLGLKL